MEVKFVRERITQLRIEKGVSEYQMSLDLGMSKGYIQGISSGKALPSLEQLLKICEYCNISPKEFFDEKPEETLAQNRLWSKYKLLSVKDMAFVEGILDYLQVMREEKGETS